MMKYAQMLITGDGIDRNPEEAQNYLNKVQICSSSSANSNNM